MSVPTRKTHLAMHRAHLAAPNPASLPEGCQLARVGLGALPGWRRLLTEVLGESDDGRPGVKRWGVRAGEEWIGAAATWRPVYLGEEAGYLGALAVKEGFRRRGIGRALVAACLEEMAREGRRCARLDTEEGREGAVRLFLATGFLPDPETPDERSRWVRVARGIGRDDLARALGD